MHVQNSQHSNDLNPILTKLNIEGNEYMPPDSASFQDPFEGDPPIHDLDWSVPYESDSHPGVLGNVGRTSELKHFDSSMNSSGDRVILSSLLGIEDAPLKQPY